MMTQTLALLLDAYRELNAKKMFWIVLILNLLAIGGFATLGVSGNSFSILGYVVAKDFPQAHILYKWLFSTFVVGLWLTWVAALLALISTAGIFPDFLSSGSIDLFLAKPISRLRLFFTKYVAGLLFVTLQVTLFAFLSFLVLGLRAGLWQPGLFLAVPLVLLFFSYLFSICTLLGVWTRSTIAALLLTLLAWLGIWAFDYVDKQLHGIEQMIAMQHEESSRHVAFYDKQIARYETGAATGPESRVQSLREQRDVAAHRRDDTVVPPALHTAGKVVYILKSFVPKTRETIALLDRVLFSDKDLQQASRHDTDEPAVEEEFSTTGPDTRPGFRTSRRGDPDVFLTMQVQADRQRPTWWIIGTSLLFEAVVLALAAWSFCRRDF